MCIRDRGILVSYLSNYALEGIGENAWRWMLGVEAIPALLFMVTIFFIPESPRWLILKRNKIHEAREILNVSDAGEAERVVVAILKSQHKSTTGSFRDLFKPLYKTPVRLAVLFALFNQLSGINAIIYYAPRVFEMAGLGKESALLSSAGIGLVNLLATLLGLSLIDKFGRKFLMYVGTPVSYTHLSPQLVS